MSDGSQFKSPGEMISEAREAQDLTLAQLSGRTKIPPPVLTALERDEYHKISGPLYIKSFLRTCAVDLGLDPEVVLAEYAKVAGERESTPQGKEMVWGEEEVQVSTIGLPWLHIVLTVGVVAVVVGLGMFALRGCGDNDASTGAPAFPPAGQVAELDSSRQQEPSDTAPEMTDEEETPRESLIPAALEEELQPRTEEVQKADEMTPETGSVADTKAHAGPDTLALGWSLNPAIAEQKKDPPVIPAEEPVEIVPVAAEEAVTRPAEENIRPATTPAAPVSYDPGQGLVLRISCDRPQRIKVKRDGERDFREADWPDQPETAPADLTDGFATGRAYLQGNRLVVFWGADDHFSLILERVQGVEVAINGRVRDISKLRAGQELLLDVHSAGR